MVGRAELRRAANLLSANLLRHRSDTGQALCVVVVASDDNRGRLDPCLHSIVAGMRPHDRVLICPVGAPVDEGNDDWIGRDQRIERLAPQRTWQDAANLGASRSDTAYLAFMRAGDGQLPGAIPVLMDRAQGAPDAIGAEGGLCQLGPRGATLPTRLAVPNRVIRRAAWVANDSRFTTDDDWLLAGPIGRLWDAGSFEYVDRLVVEAGVGSGVRSVSADPSPLSDLEGWLGRCRAVRATLEPAGTVALHEDVAVGWLPRFLMDVERATDPQWEILVHLAQESRVSWPEADLTSTSARVLRWLAATERQEESIELAAELSALGTDVPTKVVAGRVLANWRSIPDDFPVSVSTLSAPETRLRSRVHRVAGDELRRFVDVFVTIDGVDLRGTSPELLATDAVGRPMRITANPPDPAATRWLQRRFQSADVGSFRITVNGAGPDEATLDLQVSGIKRRGQLTLPALATTRRRKKASTIVDELTVDDRTLVVRGSGPLGRLRLEATDSADSVGGTADDEGVRLSLESVRFGRRSPMPVGRYRLVTTRGGLSASDALRAEVPAHQVGSTYRLQTDVGPDRGRRTTDRIEVWLRPPLADVELGPYAQERLQDGYRVSSQPVDPQLYYFDSYAGRAATDNPIAIFQELRGREPAARIRWGVSDYGHWVPEGADPVLRRSQAWYDVLATAGCFVVNTDFDTWFRKRPGQFVLQCFHGYPAKAMGAMQWQLNELSPSQIRVLRARGVDSWDLILTPTPDMTKHYREQYDYQGPAIERGYPRNDALVGPEADSLRDRVRNLLGIRDDQSAVLYAPTWRDHLAIRPRAAEQTDYFSATQAAAAWGDSHVILKRGHRFHAPGSGGPGIIDVTDYPEVNDLILASDAAVLDYSSLRFDYALTGKPMVFLVPDLDEFSSTSRGFLFPFRDSAPGPCVADTPAVVDLLRDVVALKQKYADRLIDFNAVYNPYQDGRAAERAVDELLRQRLRRC